MVPAPSMESALTMELTPEVNTELITAIEWDVVRVTHLWTVI